MGGARAKYSSDGITFNNIYGSVVGAPSLYTMPSFHQTCIYIGRYTANSATNGNTVRLRLCFSNGYTGVVGQMMDTYVNFCFGNGSGKTLYNCWVDYLPKASEDFVIKYKVTDSAVDFYCINNNFNGCGYYTVSYNSSGGVWEDKCTNGSEPSGLQLPTEIGKEVVVSSTAPASPSAMIWIQT